MFLLSTDGYRNAHGSDAGSEEAFHRTAREFADALQNQDPAKVFADLPETLNYASAKGSGDDITVGLLWRLDAPKLPPLESSASAAMPNGQTSDIGASGVPPKPVSTSDSPTPQSGVKEAQA
jgi:hypothetical protein